MTQLAATRRWGQAPLRTREAWPGCRTVGGTLGSLMVMGPMAEPSQYELGAWADIQAFTGRPLSRVVHEVGSGVAKFADAVATRTSEYLEEGHPRAKAALEQGKDLAAKSVQAVSDGARAIVPEWAEAAGGAAKSSVGKLARVGLSPKRVVAKHRRHGHEVERLRDLRALDLEQIDLVKGRAAHWGYPIAATLSGAGAGLVITGGQLVTAVSAGAGAAPSGTAITGAVVGDAAWVLALASRVVGRTSLLYGYDPETPAEKLFVMSVVNAGSAATSGAKAAAFSDVSKLTQALVRGKSWAVLNESAVARVAQEFAKRFFDRLTKQGLGKVVPAAGIILGGSLNWATLESIMDTADVLYRRRFLLEKYPQLAAADSFGVVSQEADAEASGSGDEEISLTQVLAQEGVEFA